MKKAVLILLAISTASCGKCLKCEIQVQNWTDTQVICKDELPQGETIKGAVDNLEQNGYHCQTFYE